MITAQQIIQIAEKHPGADRKVSYHKKLKIKSSYIKKNPEAANYKIEKRSEFYIRFVEYGNQKAVKEAKANGRADCPNNWTRITRGIYRDNEGNLKICASSSALNLPRKASFFLNDKEVKLEQIQEMLYASDYKEKEKPEWFTLKQENIQQLDTILV